MKWFLGLFLVCLLLLCDVIPAEAARVAFGRRGPVFVGGRRFVPAGRRFVPAGRRFVPAGRRFVPAGRRF